MSSPKNPPDLSRQTGRDNKRPAPLDRTPSKSNATTKVGNEQPSQSRQRIVSGTASSRPRTSSNQVKKPSEEAAEPEPEAASPATGSSKTKSSGQVKKPAGDADEPGADEPSTVDEKEAPGDPEPDAADGAPAEGATEAAPADDKTAEEPGKEEEETPELEKAEHDLGERLAMPEAEIDKFESKDRDFQDVGQQEDGMEDDSKHASQLAPEEWEELLENCGALCGWYIDRESNRIVQAPKPAFQLRRQRFVSKVDFQALAGTGSDAESTDVVTTSDAARDEPAEPASAEPQSEESDKPCSKPRFHVTDNSYVSVTIASDEFQTSMATNDFSSHSTEASVGGGFGGFAASVSGGHAASKSNSNVNTASTFQKTMVAKYMFPRATVYLDPSELEPTPELLAALWKIDKTKSILDMRKMHEDFGQLFCKQVTVGGRLLTTKIMTTTENKSEQVQKEEYKASVAVSASYGAFSASVKHEQGGGNSTAKGQVQTKSSESHSFEAVGGDTLLASNPGAWTATCASYSNWRVIDRINLTPMADAIAQVPGLHSVKALFAQAIPALSRYTEMSQTREIKARLRLVSPTSQLSMSYLSKNRQEYTEISYYLGHAPNYEVSPSYLRIKDPINAFWDPEFDTQEQAQKLFFPSSFRAPAIYGRASKIAAPIADTVWSITAPFDDVLKHECRVMLRTVPPASKPQAGQPANQPPSVALSIFRTQQGEFLPVMSDESQGHIFRMLKRGSTQPGETIKEGDQIRLCWNFADQTAGYRDFANDAFGRRRHNWPAEVEQVPLFFKLPWPRFESLAAPDAQGTPIPNSMIMSPGASEEGMIDMIGTLPAWSAAGAGAKVLYGMQDLSFSLDVVETDNGDSDDDYMLLGPNARGQAGAGLSRLAAQFFLDTKF